MTSIESIYEIEADLHDLQPYLYSKNGWVVKRAREKYEQLIYRFFREQARIVNPKERTVCLDDDNYFLSLMESTRKSYYSDSACSPSSKSFMVAAFITLKLLLVIQPFRQHSLPSSHLNTNRAV